MVLCETVFYSLADQPRPVEFWLVLKFPAARVYLEFVHIDANRQIPQLKEK